MLGYATEPRATWRSATSSAACCGPATSATSTRTASCSSSAAASASPRCSGCGSTSTRSRLRCASTARRRSSADRTPIWGFCAFGTDESVAALAQSLGPASYRLHHSAVRFRRVDAIPTTSSGKIDYRAGASDGRPARRALLERRAVLAAARRRRRPLLIAGLNGLTAHHRDRCAEYARMLDAAYPDAAAAPRPRATSRTCRSRCSSGSSSSRSPRTTSSRC